jgi:hypothetical protein
MVLIHIESNKMFPKFNIGKSGEELVCYTLSKLGFDCELNNVYELRYDYDISVKKGKLKFTIEVKHDVMACKTNNCAIEYHNSKKDQPSGINATLADIWVQLIPDKQGNISIYGISVDKLKQYIESHEPHKHIISGGEQNSNIFIYKLCDILPHFIRLDTITNPNIMESAFESMLGISA